MVAKPKVKTIRKASSTASKPKASRVKINLNKVLPSTSGAKQRTPQGRQAPNNTDVSMVSVDEALNISDSDDNMNVEGSGDDGTEDPYEHLGQYP
jgi:hypothetical protein